MGDRLVTQRAHGLGRGALQYFVGFSGCFVVIKEKGVLYTVWKTAN